jgi:cytochrome P450
VLNVLHASTAWIDVAAVAALAAVAVAALCLLAADFNPDRWLQPLRPLPSDVAGHEPATSQSEAVAAADLKNPDGSSSSTSCPISSSSSDSSVARPSGLLTFSVGPHACLGYSLFMTEAKVLLALLARAYDVEPVEPDSLNFKANFVTILKQGTLKFSAREQPLPCTASEYVRHSSATDVVY